MPTTLARHGTAGSPPVHSGRSRLALCSSHVPIVCFVALAQKGDGRRCLGSLNRPRTLYRMWLRVTEYTVRYVARPIGVRQCTVCTVQYTVYSYNIIAPDEHRDGTRGRGNKVSRLYPTFARSQETAHAVSRRALHCTTMRAV